MLVKLSGKTLLLNRNPELRMQNDLAEHIQLKSYEIVASHGESDGILLYIAV